MNFLDYDEAVPGLPKRLKPDFWKVLIGDTFWLTPSHDEEFGVVWKTFYEGPFHDKVNMLTRGQILTGLKDEILLNISILSTRAERAEYLDDLHNYFRPDGARIKAEERTESVSDFANVVDDEVDILITLEHSQLIVELQSMIQAAYTWQIDEVTPTPDITRGPENTGQEDGPKPSYAAIVYIEVAEYLDNAMDDKGKFLPDRNLGGTNDDHFRRYAEAIRSKFGVSFKGSTLEKDYGRRTKGLISTLQRKQAYELLKRLAPTKTVNTYYLELKERQMKQFTSY